MNIPPTLFWSNCKASFTFSDHCYLAFCRDLFWDLYVSYTAELSQTVGRHGLQLHQYADDSQIYASVSIRRHCISCTQFSCLHHVTGWMSASRLALNPTKTQVMRLGWNQQVRQIHIVEMPVMSTQVKVVDSAVTLGSSLTAS